MCYGAISVTDIHVTDDNNWILTSNEGLFSDKSFGIRSAGVFMFISF